MRLAHDYVLAAPGDSVRTTLDREADEFGERMGYAAGRYSTREELLAETDVDWARELHAALRELLEPSRRTLSVGSGFGEHEARLAVSGYRIVASDIVVDALADAARLFPELEVRRFDVLAPDGGRWDDVLIASLDYALDDAQLTRALGNVRAVLAPGGRLIFVLRYQDTAGTWLIDRVLAPALTVAVRAKARLTGSGQRIVRREHGFRRTRKELMDVARRAGFRVERVRHAGYGVELQRVDVHRRAPGLYRFAHRIDRRLRIFNIATVFELVPEEESLA